MLSSYLITLEGHAEPIAINTDQRDLFGLRRRGYKECGYDSPDDAMALFETAAEAGATNGNGKSSSDAELAKLGLEALTTISWLIWHACTRLELTASDFDTFAERELITIAPDTSGMPGVAGARPTQRAMSAGGLPGSP